MKTKRSLKTVKISKCDLACHNDALNAYSHSKSIRTHANSSMHLRSDLTSKDVDFVRESQYMHPLICVRTTGNDLRFFSGWRWYEQCLLLGIDQIEVIEYRCADNINIEKYAWRYLLSEHVFDMQKIHMLMQLVYLVEAIPDNLRPELLASNYSRSPVVAVQKMTGSTREAVRWAIDNKQNSRENTASIISELLKGGSIGDL